jgi:putative MATE family efflux protein
MSVKMKKGFWVNAAVLALPIAFQNLLTSCASLIDTAMIVPLGNSATAAVGVAGRFTFMLNVVAFGICSGAATLISQFWGINDRKGIRRTFGLALVAAAIIAVLFSLLLGLAPKFCVSLFGPEADVAVLAEGYLRILAIAVPFIMFSQVSCAALRATENVIVPLISSFASVIVNTSLNYCLISGHFGFPALGVHGAAVATVVGCSVQAIIVLVFLLFSKNVVKGSARELFGFSRSFVSKFIVTAAPVLLNESMWALGTNIYVMVLSRQGTENYSAYSIYETVQQLFFVFFVGICHASAIMVGKACGRGDREEAYETAKRFLIMTPLSGIVLGALLILARNPLLSLFEFETEGARAITSALLLFYGVWIGIRMIPYTAVCGIFRAGGDTRIGCIYEIGTLYLIGIPMVCIAAFVLHLPFVAIVATMFIAEDIPKGTLCIIYFLRKKWIRKLT